MSFYLTLPSNASTNRYANTQSNYTTLLDNPLNFGVPYEVALVEFSYREFILFEIGSINIKFPDKTEDFFNREIFRKFNLYAYDNEPIDHIIDRFNFEIVEYYSKLAYCGKKKLITDYEKSDHNDFLKQNWNKIRKHVDFDESYYQTVNNKYQILCPEITLYRKSNNHAFFRVPSGTTFYFDGSAQNIFKNSQSEIKNNFDFLILSELLNFVDYLMVYCDLVESQLVGDTYAPLLRTICKTGEFNKTTEKIFSNPHYLPVCKSFINTINISVRDPSGERVKFDNLLSKVILKLHFRPINNA